MHEGGREITRAIDLGTIPLYVRAGAALPMGPLKQYTSEQVDGPITVTMFPGADGSSSLYEDDGETFNFRNGQYMRLEMHWQDAARKLTLALARGTRMLRSAPLQIQLKAAGAEHETHVAFKGDPVTITL
jgi:alpha-glucosidase (family GH31 glycosyl hydrolase)